MKNKNKKRWIKILGGAAGGLFCIVAAYFLYIILDYHRLEDRLELEIKKPVEEKKAEAVQTEKEYLKHWIWRLYAGF